MQPHTRLIFSAFMSILMASFVFAQDPFSFSSTSYGFDHSRGVGWADFNGDGYLDIVTTSGDNNWPSNYNNVFINNGDKTFTEQTSGPLATDDFVSGGLTIGDYDNDGDPDVFVADVYRVPVSFPNEYKTTYSLYTNNSGSFARLDNHGDLSVETSECGVTAAWGDYNNDGYLDIALSTQYIKFQPAKNFNAMYLNNQDGTFTKQSNAVTANETHQGGIAWGDYDGDGDLDLVTVAGFEYQNTTLWTNTGTDFTGTTLLSSEDAKSASWADYDNDGDLDLLIIISGADLDAGAVVQDNVMFRNDNGTLTNVEVGELTTDTYYSKGSAWGDYDNDGDLDVFVGSFGGDTGPQKGYLYVNSGGTFTKLAAAVSLDSTTYTEAAAFGDMDNDGDLDLITGRSGNNYLFENVVNNTNHFINIELIGVTANRSAIGSTVRVKATINGEPVWQMREISSQTGFGSQNALRAHFGLGDATMIDSILVYWQGSGNTDYLTNVPADQFLKLTEGQVSAISDYPNQAPASYKLLQNYPNPFNPVTAISYQIKTAGDVRLDVYNALGQRVQALVDRPQSAGTYTVEFNGTSLPSGIYFYKLTSGTFSTVRKMVLMK